MTDTKSSSFSNNNKLPLNLPQLQNLIKRDPASYQEEFQRHYLIYEAALGIFNQNPSTFNQELHDLVLFLSQVAYCYSSELKEFPDDLIKLLRSHGPVLHPTQRNGFVRALILLRNKNLLPPTTLLVLFFELLRCPDKSLRKFLELHIVTDISNINKRCKNNKLNKELQNFMHGMIADNHAVAARTALGVLVQLYDKQVWNDTKTVNLIVEAVFSKVSKISVAAIKFFISRDKEEDKSDDSDSDDGDVPNLRVTLLAQRVGKKTRKKQNYVDKVKAAAKKRRKKEKTKAVFDFSALHLIHDPQSVAERLYRKLETTNERFEVKLMMMNFISRLIGVHNLYLGNFYPLIQRFLFPHQREVTKVMTYAAQAAHSHVPPDDLAPVVRTLAENFVTERCNNEAVAMGLNAIRELCARNHYCMDGDLLEDLAEYRTHKDKGIMMAAKGLIAVFRERNPALLRRKDRSAPTELSVEEGHTTEFGALGAKTYVPGAEVITYTGGENESDEDSDSEMDDSDSEEETDNKDKKEKMKEGSQEENNDDSSLKSDAKNLTRKEAIKEVMKLKPEERKAMAQEITTTRFLTDADFNKIEAVQAAKQAELWAKGRKNKKRRLEEEKPGNGEIVREDSIVMIYKKRKHDKDARLESVNAGREGREKYGAKTGRMNPFASTTNKEKKKQKAFMMLKHKLRGKQKVSFQTKQARLKASLLKQQRNLIK